jgi:hypothetical protein
LKPIKYLKHILLIQVASRKNNKKVEVDQNQGIGKRRIENIDINL